VNIFYFLQKNSSFALTITNVILTVNVQKTMQMYIAELLPELYPERAIKKSIIGTLYIDVFMKLILCL